MIGPARIVLVSRAAGSTIDRVLITLLAVSCSIAERK